MSATSRERPGASTREFEEGLRLQAAQRRIEAAQCYARALQTKPDFFEAAFNLGLVFQEMGKLEEAIACYRQVLQLKPNYAAGWANLGQALRLTGHRRDGLDCLKQALVQEPENLAALNNLGNAFRAEMDYPQALECFQNALGRSPGDARLRANLGNTLRESGRAAEAETELRRVVQECPSFVEAHVDLGITLLLEGKLKEGFAEYEWRWRQPNFPARKFTRPLWQGESLVGKTLLVHAEQGAGDAIQFIRFAGLLDQRGAQVIVECHPALKRLFSTVAGASNVLARGEVLPAFDFHVPLLSLPHLLGTTLETIPSKTPYLSLPPHSTRQVLACEPRAQRVGLVWKGNPAHRLDAVRSISFPLFESILDVPGVSFFSLQVPAEPNTNAAAKATLTDLSPRLKDYTDTAAVLNELDLLITVDTSVAHLAGALGKPVWLLLPFVPDWRWLLAREDSPWYPSIRLFRQPAPGDWQTVLKSVRRALA